MVTLFGRVVLVLVLLMVLLMVLLLGREAGVTTVQVGGCADESGAGACRRPCNG
jgi:hypothetical protein